MTVAFPLSSTCERQGVWQFLPTLMWWVGGLQLAVPCSWLCHAAGCTGVSSFLVFFFFFFTSLLKISIRPLESDPWKFGPYFCSFHIHSPCIVSSWFVFYKLFIDLFFFLCVFALLDLILKPFWIVSVSFLKYIHVFSICLKCFWKLIDIYRKFEQGSVVCSHILSFSFNSLC